MATCLIQESGDDLTPAYYVMGLAAITTAVLWSLPETANRALAGPPIRG